MEHSIGSPGIEGQTIANGVGLDVDSKIKTRELISVGNTSSTFVSCIFMRLTQLLCIYTKMLARCRNFHLPSLHQFATIRNKLYGFQFNISTLHNHCKSEIVVTSRP